jgi:hypothetical protein
MLNNPNSRLPSRLWIKRKIKKAGWDDKELSYIIGNRESYILGFTDGAMLIQGFLDTSKKQQEKTYQTII